MGRLMGRPIGRPMGIPMGRPIGIPMGRDPNPVELQVALCRLRGGKGSDKMLLLAESEGSSWIQDFAACHLGGVLRPLLAFPVLLDTAGHIP